MDRVAKVKVFAELVDLINLYSVGRDMPVDKDFFNKVKEKCDQLDLDYQELKKTFDLKDWKEMFKD